MRYVKSVLVFVLLLLCCASAHASLRLASFNAYHLGWSNEKDIAAMAQVIGRFDVIALQEVMDAGAVDRLVSQLEADTGDGWRQVTSHEVGRSSYKERYTLLWREDEASFEGGATVYLDPDDVFAREPLSAVFTDNDDGQRFVLATVHIVYGDGRSDRTPEIKALAEYWGWLEANFDAPVILVGDFNMPPDDPAWRALGTNAKPLIREGASTLSSSTDGYANLYDNIWVRPGQLDIASAGIARYPDWLGMPHSQARKHVSDHAPVYMTLGNVSVDTSAASGARSAAPAPATTRCVDLNDASLKRLETITHVGPARAKAIVKARPWDAASDLTEIRGLGKARVQDIQAEGRVCQ